MTEYPAPTIRPPTTAEHAWVKRQLETSWGSTTIVSRGQIYDASAQSALLAVDVDSDSDSDSDSDEIVGLATYRLAEEECELLTLDALHKHRGIGSALLAAVASTGAEHGCHRLWLITSNDNLDAIRFYQRRGLRLVAVHRGAIDAARELKPSIPLIGGHGIALHDELEFELGLG
jgi:ribosomal protein S18 acetylase RimI-like enzyme